MELFLQVKMVLKEKTAMSRAPDSNNCISGFPQDNHCTVGSNRSALYTLSACSPKILKRCALTGRDLRTLTVFIASSRIFLSASGLHSMGLFT